MSFLNVIAIVLCCSSRDIQVTPFTHSISGVFDLK